MNIKRVKQGAKITFYNGIYTIVLGAYLIFFVNFNMTQTFNSRSQLWGFFLRYDSQISFIFYLFNIIAGIFLISQGIIIMYLSDFIIKRKEKMTWVILFFSGLITWVGLLAVSILLQNWILITMSFLGCASFLFGMLLPVSYYIEKPYKEY